ncbi:MAG: MaoC/PaaZ C-terminal domain-containing protein, partial [Gemmatimonadota bacterium]
MLSRAPDLRSLRLDEVRVGDHAALHYVVGEDDVECFARLTGDRSPLHVDEAFARSSRYGARVAHGMLVAAP